MTLDLPVGNLHILKVLSCNFQMKDNGSTAKVIAFDAKRWSVTKTPHGIAEKGEALYRDKFQAEYEQKYPGKYLAIDVESETGFLGDTPERAVEALLNANKNAFYHLVRIGAPGVYRVGYAQENSRDWLFR